MSESTPFFPNRTICLPFSEEEYLEMIPDASRFRTFLNEWIERFPQLFPAEIQEGYRMKDIRYSSKLSFPLRRIEIRGISYSIRPAFALPYMTGRSHEVEKALFLRKFQVPFWALAYVFGKDAMYWYRLETALGRNSIVGTTLQHPEHLPAHLLADEKHTWVLGQKTYVATTVADGCILGASLAQEASESSLLQAYGVFQQEAQLLNPHYSPKTVNTDGWEATQNAWKKLFPCISLILCFLHVFIKIRDRAQKKYKDLFSETATRLWHCYTSLSKASFSQSVRRFHEWAQRQALPPVMMEPIEKLRKSRDKFAIAYDFPEAHRTSNMLDRLLQRMDRHLFSTQYFHGTVTTAEQNIRAWALIHNFAPSNPYTLKLHDGWQSPAERLNQFRYHPNWLQNLLISASLGGFRSPPQNPL